jgi:LysM repeat protein
MRFFSQLGVGLLTALASSLLVFGALSLASAEGLTLATPTPEPTQTAPAVIEPGAVTPTLQPTSTPLPPTACPPPKGWVPYTVLNGDTLDSLAQAAKIPVDQVASANCLISSSLLPGTILYLPPSPTPKPTKPTKTKAPSKPSSPSDTPVKPSATTRSCQPPPGWVIYIVQPSDNLFRISLAYGTTVATLQAANCLPNPNNISAGMRLWVPNVPTRTPTKTSTRTPVPPTRRPSTNTPVPPTRTPVTPSNTPVTPSNTPVTPSNTPVTPSNTPVTPSDTPVPSETPTDTPSP